MVGFISPMSDKSKSMVSLRRSLSGAWTPMESAEPSFVLLRRIWENAPLSKNGTPQPVQPAVSMVSFAIIYYIILMLLFFLKSIFEQIRSQPANLWTGNGVSRVGQEYNNIERMLLHAMQTAPVPPGFREHAQDWAMQSWGCLKMG